VALEYWRSTSSRDRTPCRHVYQVYMIWAQLVHKFVELSLLGLTSSRLLGSLDHFHKPIAFVFLVFI
jgi:hypothetical protein